MLGGSFDRSRSITSLILLLDADDAPLGPDQPHGRRPVPSSTSSTYSRSTSLSLCSSGSHSAALISTVSALAASLTWVGKPAPPAPTTPASGMSSTVISGILI